MRLAQMEIGEAVTAVGQRASYLTMSAHKANLRGKRTFTTEVIGPNAVKVVRVS